MNAVVLAAGYATRLYPLTITLPKPLLPIAEVPILDRIAAKIEDVEQVEELHVVTNSRFAMAFTDWASEIAIRFEPLVYDDGTRTNEDRLGAIGDLHLVVERGGLLGDDALVVAGDNIFDFALTSFVDFWETKGVASAVALYDCGSPELATQYGVVEVDADDRVISFVEKPAEPPTTLVSTAAYIFHSEHMPLFEQYYAEGHSLDAPGSFVAWLSEREPVYGYRFDGSWFDIGDLDQLLVADNAVRAQEGLPERDEYVIEPSAFADDPFAAADADSE